VHCWRGGFLVQTNVISKGTRSSRLRKIEIIEKFRNPMHLDAKEEPDREERIGSESRDREGRHVRKSPRLLQSSSKRRKRKIGHRRLHPARGAPEGGRCGSREEDRADSGKGRGKSLWQGKHFPSEKKKKLCRGRARREGDKPAEGGRARKSTSREGGQKWIVYVREDQKRGPALFLRDCCEREVKNQAAGRQSFFKEKQRRNQTTGGRRRFLLKGEKGKRCTGKGKGARASAY